MVNDRMKFISALLISMMVSAFAQASDNDELLVEKTFSRDNTFCKLNKKIIEINIRGEGRYTEMKENGFGQYVFQIEGKKYTLLPFNKDRLGRYRFYRGDEGPCTKSLSYLINTQTLAVLFLRENLPFKEKLVIQLFDLSTAKPKEAIETNILTDRIEAFRGGFAFRTLKEKTDVMIGRVNIQGEDFIFQDADLSPWMSYSSIGLETLGSKTFDDSQWKKFFKSEAEFFEVTGWNPSEKKFSNTIVYSAVNHATKKECVFFSPTPLKVSGQETWRCLAKK